MHLYVRLLCCWDGNKSTGKFPAYELKACFTVHSLKKEVPWSSDAHSSRGGRGFFVEIHRALNGCDYMLQKNLLPSVCKGNEKLMRLDSLLFFSSRIPLLRGIARWQGERNLVGKDEAERICDKVWVVCCPNTPLYCSLMMSHYTAVSRV